MWREIPEEETRDIREGMNRDLGRRDKETNSAGTVRAKDRIDRGEESMRERESS